MVSVIICSINTTLARQVEKNIHETIGVPWELILTDNAQLKKGITYVYNQGAAKARYDILCFVHEDVLFQTPSWGKIIQQYFENDLQLGLIGVAGSKYKSKALSGWWSGIPSLDCSNIMFPQNDQLPGRAYSNPDPAVQLHEVVTADGVFMCARKSVWEANPFNETLLDGFHFYDIDFSFRIARRHKVAVTFSIDILHLTRWGNFGNDWLRYAFRWHKLHASEMPLKAGIASIAPNTDRTIYKHWLLRLKNENIHFANRLRWIFQGSHWLHASMWPYIGLFVFYKIFNRRKDTNPKL
ncbi:MAG TPA: glycosyltransferase [Chitinophagaceae bacterium]|nr:glycosyltransferase [Chitinophagaceae bacterium]